MKLVCSFILLVLIAWSASAFRFKISVNPQPSSSALKDPAHKDPAHKVPAHKDPAHKDPVHKDPATSSSASGSPPSGSTPSGSTPSGSTPYGSTPPGTLITTRPVYNSILSIDQCLDYFKNSTSSIKSSQDWYKSLPQGFKETVTTWFEKVINATQALNQTHSNFYLIQNSTVNIDSNVTLTS